VNLEPKGNTMPIDPLSDAAFEDLEAMTPDAGDRALRVRFFLEPFKDEEASANEGRPIFKSVEMVEIRIPGNKDNVVVQRVSKMDPDPRERFPAQYAKFKGGDPQQHVGTMLRKWGILDEAEALSYEAVGIFTVEQLAGMTDAACKQYRGSLGDRQKAQDWLDTAKGAAPVAAARAEVARLREELAALREQLGEITRPAGTPKAKRGPKKPPTA
jgi:hypothetical protein